MKKTIVFLFIFLFATACNKKRTLHIKAINAVTGEPYAGLAYGISATTTGIGGEKKVYDHKGTLDANGEAFVTLRVRGNRTYNVGCTKPPNTCYVKDINFSFGKEDKTKNDFQFEYAECGYIQLKVKNISCYDANDKIFFNLKPSYTDPNYKIIQMTKLGCFDFEFIDEPVPYGPWIATWQVTKNGVTSNYDSTFYINENQHYYFLLEY
ncbi:MAG: hypothetical protein WC044_13610 [Crocinitomicaceae bacterium]